MTKAIQRVKSKRPDLVENESVRAVTDDLDRYEPLAVLASTDGGKVILESLRLDILSAIGSLNKYKTASHAELMAACATLTERLNIYRSLTNAKKNKEGALIALEKILNEE